MCTSGSLRLPSEASEVGDEAGDQRRIVTPESAVADGATHLVVGRSITASDDPAKTAAGIRASLDAHASG